MRGTFLLADFHHEVERLARGVRSAVGDKGAAAGISFDQTFFAESFHCLAHGGAADAKALRQFTLCRKLVARVSASH